MQFESEISSIGNPDSGKKQRALAVIDFRYRGAFSEEFFNVSAPLTALDHLRKPRSTWRA
jgi:hypothetical protein